MTTDKNLQEESPTNSMGTSSTTAGSGAIDAPERGLGKKKKMLKRFKELLKNGGRICK